MLRRVRRLPLTDGWIPPAAADFEAAEPSRDIDDLETGMLSTVDRDSAARTEATT
jgi:hypothetical protein